MVVFFYCRLDIVVVVVLVVGVLGRGVDVILLVFEIGFWFGLGFGDYVFFCGCLIYGGVW